MGEIVVRRAGLADAEVLAALGRETFTDTFAHLYPPKDLQVFLEDAYTPSAFAAFIMTAAHAMWLAEEDGRALGYAHAGPCALPHPEVTSRCGEVKRLYVSKDAQNRRIGAALLKTALDWLDAPGRRLWIGVWSHNLGAQRLYGRFGFRKAGEYQFPVGDTLDDEFILSRP